MIKTKICERHTDRERERKGEGVKRGRERGRQGDAWTNVQKRTNIRD